MRQDPAPRRSFVDGSYTGLRQAGGSPVEVIPRSPMPWNAFARMTDDDLRAVYRYLRTVPPVEQEMGPALRRK